MYSKKVKQLIQSDPNSPILVDPLQMQQHEHDLLIQAHEACLKMCEANYLDALEQAYSFNYVERQHRKQKDPESTSYRCYVRMRYGTSVTCNWYCVHFNKVTKTDPSTNKTSEKWVVNRRYPQLKQDGNYSKWLFKHSPDWVQTYGKKAEEIFKIVRNRDKLLSEIRSKLYELDRLNTRLFDLNDVVRMREEDRPEKIDKAFISRLNQ